MRPVVRAVDQPSSSTGSSHTGSTDPVTRAEAILEGLAYAGLDDDLSSAVDAQLELPREAWPP